MAYLNVNYVMHIKYNMWGQASGQESPTLAALRQQGRAGEDWLREEPGRQTPGGGGQGDGV